jgi:hypothetical protein
MCASAANDLRPATHHARICCFVRFWYSEAARTAHSTTTLVHAQDCIDVTREGNHDWHGLPCQTHTLC